MVEAEIVLAQKDCFEDAADQFVIRRLILEAADEMDYWNEANDGLPPDIEPTARPALECADSSEWADLVDALRTEILEDDDFSMEKKFMDMPPDEAAALKRHLNINPNYFVAVVEDPTPERVAAIQRELLAYLN